MPAGGVLETQTSLKKLDCSQMFFTMWPCVSCEDNVPPLPQAFFHCISKPTNLVSLSLDLHDCMLPTVDRTALGKCVSYCNFLKHFRIEGPAIAEIVCNLPADLECLKCPGCDDLRLAAPRNAKLASLQELRFSDVRSTQMLTKGLAC